MHKEKGQIQLEEIVEYDKFYLEIDATFRQLLFKMQDNDILLQTAVMPSMITTDKTVIRQDCFCYLMERYSLADDVSKPE